MRNSFTHQIKCPISGKPIGPAYFVEYRRKGILLLSGLLASIKASPEQYASKLYQFTHKDERRRKDEWIGTVDHCKSVERSRQVETSYCGVSHCLRINE